MKTSMFRARQISLALLVAAVVEHGHLQADYTGANPNSSGLLRLGRELLRRREETRELVAGMKGLSRGPRRGAGDSAHHSADAATSPLCHMLARR